MKQYYKGKLIDSPDSTAIIVPYWKLDKLKIILGDSVEINCFEALGDVLNLGSWSRPHKTRRVYSQVIDLTEDEELWEHSGGLLDDQKHLKKIKVDCIINTFAYSVEEYFTRELAAKMWKGKSYREASFWNGDPGVRDHTPWHNPRLLLSNLFSHDLYRMPVRGGASSDQEIASAIAKYNTVSAFLQEHCNGCGWFTGTPQYCVIDLERDSTKSNVFCDPGQEHMHILPVDSRQVSEWLLDGSVTEGKVLLVQSRDDIDIDINSDLIFTNYSNYSAIFAKNAQKVVFYCNNCSSNSPNWALEYFNWMLKNHPESRQQVVLLNKGVNDLYQYMKNTGIADINAIFLPKDSKY